MWVERYHPRVNDDGSAIQKAYQKYRTNEYFAWGDYSIRVKKLNPKTRRYRIIAEIVNNGNGKVDIKRRL